jgi:hypothetical protein
MTAIEQNPEGALRGCRCALAYAGVSARCAVSLQTGRTLDYAAEEDANGPAPPILDGDY